MSPTKMFVAFAGAALSLTTAALAQNPDQNSALQADLKADAARQVSGLQAGKPAVNVGGYIQFQYLINVRDNPPANAAGTRSDDTTVGFQLRRTRMNVSGNPIEGNDAWSYFVQFGADSSGNFVFEDAWVKYQFEQGLAVYMGQGKAPVLREELIGDTAQLARERSILNSTFTQGRSQGILLDYMAEDFRLRGAFSDGAGTLNTPFDSTGEADWSLTGRADWKWAGDWSRFDDFTSWQGSEYAGSLGGAIHYQTGGETGTSTTGVNTADVDVLRLTVDAAAEANGWNFYAAFVYDNIDNNTVSPGQSFTDYGFLVQGGIFIDAQWELFGRYDVIFQDSDRGTNVDDFSTVTVGVNHYVVPESQAAKFTIDLMYFLDAVSGRVGTDSNVGLLPDTGDGQWTLGGAFQLVY